MVARRGGACKRYGMIWKQALGPIPMGGSRFSGKIMPNKEMGL